MSKNSKHLKPSQETQDEAMKIARATQRPEQTKEQTRLIAQGIQKGITQYKKQQKSKARQLNKRLKEVHHTASPEGNEDDNVTVIYKHHYLPWLLLILSWLGISIYFVLELL